MRRPPRAGTKNLLHCEKICLCRTVRRGRRPLQTDELRFSYRSRFGCNLCRRRVINHLQIPLRSDTGDSPAVSCPADTTQGTVPGITACGFASLRLGCALQNFDSVATQPSLRMTLGGWLFWHFFAPRHGGQPRCIMWRRICLRQMKSTCVDEIAAR